MTVLGIDPGDRRIGVAVSDPLRVTARPLTTIEHESLASDAARVVALAERVQAGKIVVGLPLNLDGSAGPAARKARRFANAIRRKTAAEVVLWDERLTTVAAEEMLASGTRVRPAARRDATDKTAAAVMLQDYLDSHPESDSP